MLDAQNSSPNPFETISLMTKTEAPAAPQNPLLSAPIPGLMRKIAVPVSIGAFFNTMYNVVDTIYGGLISDQVLAALSLSFPIYFIIIAMGFGFSQGTTALIGNALGRGQREEAQELAIQGLLLGVLISFLVTAGVIWAAPTLVRFMGATDEFYLQQTLDYINPIFYGTIFFITVQMLLAILNALGNTRPGRNFLVSGFFLNLLLDPWFIFGGFGVPAMGITGIAVATVLIQFLGCIYVGYEVLRSELVDKETFARFWRPNFGALWRLVQQGFPNMVDTMGVSLGFFVLNYFVGWFGQDAVAALGAASRIEQVALLPLLGLNVAVLALVARNNGANQLDRVQEVYRKSLLYGGLLMLTTTVLAILFARPLMSMFTDDGEIIRMGVEFIRIRCLGLVPNAFFFMSASAMRGIEKPFWPLVINFVRFVFLPWLLVAIFVQGFGYGLTAIWVTSTVAFFVTAVMGLVMAHRLLPKLAG